MNKTTEITTTSKVIISETTKTSTVSHQVILPTLYTPLSSRASSTTYIDQEHTESFTVQIFTPLPTQLSSAKYDPDATLPPSYLPLSSRAPRMLTSSTTWPTSTATTTAQSLDTHQDNSLSSGQLAGIIIGSILGGLLMLYMFYVLCWTRRKALRNKENMDTTYDEKYTSSLHLPYDFSYPYPPNDTFSIPDESITSHNKAAFY
jgi:hypothetical protein